MARYRAAEAGLAGRVTFGVSGAQDLTGEFDAAELVKALNKAGFHVKVKQ